MYVVGGEGVVVVVKGFGIIFFIVNLIYIVKKVFIYREINLIIVNVLMLKISILFIIGFFICFE